MLVAATAKHGHDGSVYGRCQSKWIGMPYVPINGTSYESLVMIAMG